MIGIILLSLLSQIGGSGGSGTQGGGHTIPRYQDHSINVQCNYATAIYAPIPDCDTQLNAQCVTDAYNEFYKTVRAAQEYARQDCFIAVDAHERETAAADGKFIECMNNLSWPNNTKRGCALAHEGSYIVAKTNYNITRNKIMNTLNQKIDDAVEQFNARIAACCQAKGQ